MRATNGGIKDEEEEGEEERRMEEEERSMMEAVKLLLQVSAVDVFVVPCASDSALARSFCSTPLSLPRWWAGPPPPPDDKRGER